jgi:hypothetical protein
LIEALFGELRAEKVRTQKQLTRKLELENAITTAAVLNRAALQESFAALADALGQAVDNSDLPREACENFLHNLSTWPLRLEEVATRQSKLRTGGNGERDGGQSESDAEK